MSETTARFALPLLAAGQAQKELYHNEALALVDALLHPVVEAVGPDTPPIGAAAGQSWIVGAQPTGNWAGRAGQIALRTDGGWRFAAPAVGMAAWTAGGDGLVRFDGERWISPPAVVPAAGGTTVDIEARATLLGVIEALRAAGLVRE